jgi:ferredoxin-type protein NapH
MTERLQLKRRLLQGAFFTLFVFAPIFDIFRYDLNAGHFYLFGYSWTLGLQPLQQGLISPAQASINLLLRGFVPLFLVGGIFIYSAWRWGRLYCGWLCPHYSVVETINQLMIRAIARPSLWEQNPLPELQADGRMLKVNRLYWIPTILAIFFFSALWAISLLTYLLPPFEIYHNLIHAELTRNQFTFIAVASVLLSIEFTLARHFFCRFGCAVGFFQSLAWMSNRRAMVVQFDQSRGQLCKQCNNACDNACPMRLKPRSLKRRMFACTQCGECISSCATKQGASDASLLNWVTGEDAQSQSAPMVDIPSSRETGAAWKNR